MNTVGTPLLWGGFAVVVAIMLAIDLLLQGRRGAHAMTMKQAAAWSLVWVTLSLLFNAAFWWYLVQTERRFKKQLSVYSAVIGVHFFLLGTYPAGASAILNAIRTLITLRTRSLWVMAIFIVLTGGIGLAKFHHPVELLPVIGTIVSTWALFRCKGLTMRCVMWFSTCCWVIHNFWAGSIGGTMIEGSFLLMNGLNIIRFWRMQKRGIDPFKVEKTPSAVDERG